jgi:hypothetical protein
MKQIQVRQCVKCSTLNYYFPEDNRGGEVLVVNCCKCGTKNLLQGWEVSYTSEEDAILNGSQAFGVNDKVNIVTEKHQKPNVVEVKELPIIHWEKTMELMWIDNVLHQQEIDKKTDNTRWQIIRSNR